jgi:hypothetical protein
MRRPPLKSALRGDFCESITDALSFAQLPTKKLPKHSSFFIIKKPNSLAATRDDAIWAASQANPSYRLCLVDKWPHFF